MNNDFLYVGTYTAPHCAPGETRPSEALGIYVFRRHPNGHIELAQTVPAENPSYIVISPDRKTLYAVSELGLDSDDKPQGKVLSFRRDLKSGKLSPLNSQPTLGTWPCHLSVTNDGRHLLAANYGEGGFVVFPLDAKGGIGPLSDVKGFVGHGPDLARQSQPHPHFIAEIPHLGCVMGADLGTDRVHMWLLGASDGKLRTHTTATSQTAGGTGPRHLIVHPDSKRIVILNELSSSLDVFSPASDENSGPIWRQTLSTLPTDTAFTRPAYDPTNPGFVPAGGNTTAEIRLHPNGRFLYVTNRGMNTVATFDFDETFQRLQPRGWTPTRGERPRGMNVSPDGRFLYVGNQGSNTIVGFGINPISGNLSEPLFEIPCPTPVDYAF